MTSTWRLNAYQGDWQVPARVYREWMNKALQPANRAEMPAWINDIELVIKHHGRFELEKLRILNQLVDASKTLIYMSGWRRDQPRNGYRVKAGSSCDSLPFLSQFPLDKQNVKEYNDSYQKFAIAHQKRK